MIVGQDTDGTVTPHDLGMSWIVRKDDSDFVGRRSLSRPDTMRPDRKQLVGLLPVDPDAWLPEGAQIVVAGARGRHGAAGADARPRDVELPQPRARPHVRAGDGRGRARAASAATLVAPLPGGDDRSARSPRRSSTTRSGTNAVTEVERDAPLAIRSPRAWTTSPASRRPPAARVVLEHVPFLAQVNLRLDPSLAERAPYPLPLEPNTAWEDGPSAALWLGPDEWLILGPPHAGREIVAELEARARRPPSFGRRRQREPRGAGALRPAGQGDPVEGVLARPASPIVGARACAPRRCWARPR